MKNLTYRKCGLDDLAELVEISRKTFVAAFEKDNNPEDFQAYLDIAFNEEQIEKELMNPESEFYFVYLDELLAGYFKLNEKESQGEPFGSLSHELSRIYFYNEFQGQEVGTRSLKKIMALAKEKQKTWIWLGVWQLNVNAVRFYERHGFTKFGTHAFFIGADRQVDWLMRLDIV